MERKVGTISRGIRCPIIREGDDLTRIVVESVTAAAKAEGFSLRDRDVVSITESVVARAQGNYASTADIASDVKAKLGGGTIGVEMADFYYHMGTHVIIAEAAPQLAPTEDEDIAAHLRYTLEKHGVLCLVGVRAESLEEDEDGNARLTLADGATYTAEKGLIAAGRMPNTEHLDAENASCALNRRGFITTDYYLQSSPNSWAIGDVNGKMLFAHAATHQGEYVARTILGLEFSPYQAGPCPYCLHGSMEIMHVGLTEREAAALGGEILVSKSLFSSNVISQARGDASGFVKVVWRNGEMAGIAAIGGCATQLTLSAELLLMGQYSGSRLNSFMVAHPTLDETLVDAVKAPRRPSEY